MTVNKNTDSTAPNAEATPAIAPIEDHLTLTRDNTEDEILPTGPDDRPDGFVVGDQTAAGALTPPGGRHPGGHGTDNFRSDNVLDPHNVNGSVRNQELILEGKGVLNPDADKGHVKDETKRAEAAFDDDHGDK